MKPRACLRSFWDSKTLWMSLLIPLAAAPLPYYYPTSVAKCAYCVIVIGVFWVTEIIPLAVTSLFPAFLFPMFGIMTAKEVCRSYFKETLMMFAGSLILAVTVERWNLHKRLALRTLTLVGPQPRWLMLGIMFPCWFLSMWMSNTATCAMMMPIVCAILAQIKESRRVAKLGEVADDNEVRLMMKGDDEKHGDENTTLEIRQMRDGRGEEDPEEDQEFTSLSKTFMLCTAYSANIGGIATLTGTPPNMIFKGLADSLYQTYGATNPVNFASWLLLGLPLSFLAFLSCWLWMQLYGQGMRCFRCCSKDDSFASVKRTLWAEYKKLGSMSFPEVLVLINFLVLAVLWVTRNPGFMPGWSQFFEDGYVRDSTPAILIAAMLFILPARPPRWMACCRSKATAISEKTPLLPMVVPNEALDPAPAYQPILNWKVVNERLAWGVLLLMGGGFALADGCQMSGLSQWVSQQLDGLNTLPPWVIALLLSFFIAMATEVTSNAATTTLFIPIVGDLAVQLGVNPLYFMVPCTIAASLAFLLPAATPPNAIVFASGYLRVRDMFLGGLPMNFIALAIVNIALNSWATSSFDLSHLPEAFRNNASVSVTDVTPTLALSTLPTVNSNSTP